jgi:transcriptional regulator with XRE-family HTH domain
MLFTTMMTVGDNMTLHEGLKRYRKEVLDLKQIEVAKRLGISKSSLSQYESGARGLPHDILSKMIKLYQLSPHDLYEMLADIPYSGSHSGSSMLLREKFEDSEFERAIQVVNNSPDLRKLLSTVSYYDKKKQGKILTDVVKIIKTIDR